MKLFLSSLFLLLSIFIFSPLPTHAEENFHVAVISDYNFDESGKSRVRLQISLTNESSHLYASSYQLTIEGDNPQNLTGFDTQGPLQISANPQKDSSTTMLNIIFNEPVVGKGSTQRFTIEYDSLTANKNGQVWEIVLPKLSKHQLIDTYELNLHVPESFGSPAFITPPPTSVQENTYTFNKDELQGSGVVAAFGHLQTYSFNFSYELTNPSRKKITQTITLPPDTAYQKIFYEDIYPRPESVTIDTDGNWLASYSISPKQNLEITAIGQVRLYANPVPIPIPPPSTTLEEYLQPNKYWETTDPAIASLSSNLTSPEKIFWYVVSRLKYNRNLLSGSNQPERLGAVGTLNNPELSLCSEFTDLFITLARANGIPARKLVGYAYTNDAYLKPLTIAGNLLHTWPEYWDSESQTWISVDPTWSNTSGGVDYFKTFDLNHFVFAINGLNSESPLPIGQFNLDSNIKSSFQVQFDQYRDHTPEFPSANLKKPWAFLPFINNQLTLEITNNQGRAIYKIPVTVNSVGQKLLSETGTVQAILPPFSKLNIPVTYKGSFFPGISPQYLQVQLADRPLTYNIPQKVFFVWYGIFILITSTIVIGLAAISVHAGSLYLQRQGRDNNLHR